MFHVSFPKNKKTAGQVLRQRAGPELVGLVTSDPARQAGGTGVFSRRLPRSRARWGCAGLRGDARGGSAPWRPPPAAAPHRCVGVRRGELSPGKKRGATAGPERLWVVHMEGRNCGSRRKNDPGGGWQTMANKTGDSSIPGRCIMSVLFLFISFWVSTQSLIKHFPKPHGLPYFPLLTAFLRSDSSLEILGSFPLNPPEELPRSFFHLKSRSCLNMTVNNYSSSRDVCCN